MTQYERHCPGKKLKMQRNILRQIATNICEKHQTKKELSFQEHLENVNICCEAARVKIFSALNFHFRWRLLSTIVASTLGQYSTRKRNSICLKGNHQPPISHLTLPYSGFSSTFLPQSTCGGSKSTGKCHGSKETNITASLKIINCVYHHSQF